MADQPKQHWLSKVRISRIAICKSPAVPDSEVVLMKSTDGEGDNKFVTALNQFGERLMERIQKHLGKSNPQPQETDMDITKMTVAELEAARPDLIEAIKKAAKPTTEDITKSDPFAGLRASLDALKTEFATGIKGIGDRVEKLEKAAPPASVDLAPITKSIADLDGKIETLAKAQPQALKHGDDKDETLKKSAFTGILRTRKGHNASR